MSGIRLAEDHYIMEGTADQPVQIDCDDMQFFADHMELFEKEGRVIANGNVTYISGGNRINAERMVYYTKTRTGTFYIATGTAVLRESAQPGIFGTPGTGRVLLGRRAAEDRTQDLSHHSRRLHDVRAAGAPMGHGGQLDHAASR